jgi:hypothetical protein
LWHRKVTCRIKSREIGGAIVADVCLSEDHGKTERNRKNRGTAL